MTYKQLHEQVVTAAVQQGLTEGWFALTGIKASKEKSVIFYVDCVGIDGEDTRVVTFIVDAKFDSWKDFSDAVAGIDKQWKAGVKHTFKGEEVEEVKQESDKPVSG